MDELLKALDESVFTPELTQKIQDLYESKINTIEAEYEAKLQETEAKATEYADMIKETYEAKATEYAEYVKEELEVKATEYTEYVKEELEKTVSAFLDTVVEEYLDQNRIAIDESVKSAKLNALLEGIDSLMLTTGVSISQIAEAQKDNSVEAELASLKESTSKLVKENAKLKSENSDMVREAVVAKLSADMNLVQKDKFEKLSEMAVYTGNMDEYEAKLQTIVETVFSASAPVVNKPVEKPLSESVPSATSSESYKRFI